MARVDTVRTDLEPGPAIVLPLLSLAVLVVIAVLPWGLPSDARFVMPMVPYIAVHYWTLNGRGAMPAPIVFLAGLVIDFVTHGPVGFWSLIFLLGHMCALWLSGTLASSSLSRYVGYVATIVFLAAVQWLAASIYFVRWVEVWPFVAAVGVIAMFYPVLALLLFRSIDRKD